MSEMTLREYARREQLEDADVISVRDHKTTREHGSVKVVLPKLIAQDLSAYVTYIRPLVNPGNENEEYVFITGSGRPSNSDHVGKSLNSFWSMGGGRGKFGATQCRATASTAIHEDPTTTMADKENLATHLKHRVSTAEKSYKKKKSAAHAVQTSRNLIGKVFNFTVSMNQ